MEFLQSIYGVWTQIPVIWSILGILAIISILGYLGTPLWGWTLFAAIIFYGYGAPLWLWIVLGVFAVFFLITPIRRNVVTRSLMSLLAALKFLPKISETEQTAIEAGTVWMDGELFSGKPDFEKIRSQLYPELTDEEQAFLDGPVEELCSMVNDWDVYKNRGFEPNVWEFMKEKRFFGMIIPKKYGGLGLSAYAHSAVIAKLSSRCGPLAITVMVPNSLGPAELLLHYGTDKQKDHYLPRLATGDEIPCFALTEPHAGSDAGGLRSEGVVFKGDDGKLYIRLNWNKRWITLAAISTVHGLAFKLKDPDNLLGKDTDLGITCALIPSNLKGVVLGRRHDPMDVPFYNCPTEGHDVIISVDDIIGGVEQAGNGWTMLMQALAAGRGISLPATTDGQSMVAARVVGAHSKVRKQFGLPIGMFEGVEEPLARIGGTTYMLDALRRYTCGAIDSGAKPAIVTAIAKYNATEMGRRVVNDGMDVLGGTGITRGPRNMMAHSYMSAPISITVEGANILTRTLMIFGQGAIRCHPYAYNEIQALMNKDLKAFDKNFTKHIGHVVRNLFRSIFLSITRGHLAKAPISGPTAKYYKKLAWSSATFAFMADLAMGSLGGALKFKEKLTGRFADILSWMFIASSVLRRFEYEGQRKEDKIYLDWTMKYALAEIQDAFDGIFRHLSPPLLGWFFKGPVALWSRMNPVGRYPNDKLGHKIAHNLQVPGEQRDRLFYGIYVPEDLNEAMGRLENAFKLSYEADEVVVKVIHAIKSKKLPKGDPIEMLDKAVEAGIISSDEADLIRKAEAARDDTIQVDSFTLKEYMNGEEPYIPNDLDQRPKATVS
ncbi:MAG TPA: acyl-CoA dehydrogenase [Balneolales bacterium]|nr:acyl-CoA dehydrogenase [Balneolales bacterium]